jgi:uncharacterized membrane-anchored protein
MRNMILWVVTAMVLATVNHMVFQKERVLVRGRTMLLRLAPVDPRSLMQGDYMVLRYEIARAVSRGRLENRGRIVVALNENDVASFIRFHRGEPLQPGEHLLSYRNRGQMRLGAESFFFQEGDAALFETAAYGELKVALSGESVLVGLRNGDFQPLGRNLPETPIEPEPH